MLKKVLQRAVGAFGLEMRRRLPAGLPVLHTIQLDKDQFRLWITSQHAKSWWYDHPIRNNAETRSERSMIQPGDVVFDVGAHHGFNTVLFSIWTGSTGCVHAFEANPDNAVVLSANVGINRLTHSHAVLSAVGSHAGTVKIAGESVASAGVTTHEVPMISLDSYAESHGIDRVDFIKIDVEGFEAEVLKGARHILSLRPRIALELHLDHLARFGASASEVIALLGSSYTGEIMVRPDWDTLRPFAEIGDLPAKGVANLFLRPS